jgi:signal transduction histidine kinase
MNSLLRTLSRQYAATLCRYLARRQEALLQEAYELGRTAITRGLGVLDIARVHQRALASCLSPELPPEAKALRFEAAETFFMETLSPFEVEHRGFREANLRLHQLNDALEHRNVELAALNRDLRSLSDQILHVQEAERQRISRELHDEVGQALMAIHMNLALLERNGAADAHLLKRKIADTQGVLQETMRTVHGFARELRPAMLDELGLLPALRSYLRVFAERTGVRARFRGAPEAEALDSEQKTIVFRIAQESLTNVAKHAHASRVGVTLEKRPGAVRVQIKDNGKAFPVEEQLSATGKKHLGLLGMQERVRLVNGRFAVRSAPGKGTTVCVEIPLTTNGGESSGHSPEAINQFPCKR